MKNLHALIVGATGATGQALVDQLLDNPSFGKVSIFVRNKPRLAHKKLVVHTIDFSSLSDYHDLVSGDVLFSALGTTRKDAGSKANQYLVDYTYQYEFAKMAAQNGVPQYALVSSAGANKHSFFFYPKIKGELEAAITTLNFKTIHIYQPPLLIRPKSPIRAGEKIVSRVLYMFNAIGVLKSQKPLLVSILAKKMIAELFEKKTNRINRYTPLEIPIGLDS